MPKANAYLKGSRVDSLLSYAASLPLGPKFHLIKMPEVKILANLDPWCELN